MPKKSKKDPKLSKKDGVSSSIKRKEQIRNTLLVDDAENWLKNLEISLLHQISTLAALTDKAMQPGNRGSCGMGRNIQTFVSDFDMEYFMEKCPFKKAKSTFKFHNKFPKSPVKLLVHKWKISKAKELDEFFGNFVGNNFKTERYYYENDKGKRVEIDTKIEKILEKEKNVKEMIELRNKIAKENKLGAVKDVKSVKQIVQLGKYKRFFKINSKKEKEKEKSNSQQSKQTKTRKRLNSNGHFTIEYQPNVIPETKTGILRFNFTFYNYKNGKLDGN